jgi:hypothetical protein
VGAAVISEACVISGGYIKIGGLRYGLAEIFVSRCKVSWKNSNSLIIELDPDSGDDGDSICINSPKSVEKCG